MTETAPAPIYFDLGESASCVRRRAGWFAGPGGRPDGRLGTLRIVMQRAKRGGDSTDVDEYAVREETGTGLPRGVRSFLLKNDDNDDGAEPTAEYRCVVGSPAGWMTLDRCACKAGRAGRECKHRSALARFVSEGVI